VLAPPAEVEEVYVADAALLPQQGALTRRSYVSRTSQWESTSCCCTSALCSQACPWSCLWASSVWRSFSCC